ncbi:aldehyde dehydrogenase family protein [Virgisporangium aurantiacum]|uniref:aldehyde dehydrogenase (NAD(+)) n=1 Tax=Virgisporangium aurantiacum TaxID=175570 RepID=A0A8J3ZFD5_9ACTN|nr:aldehyde dehydrogenase family protein [Virgisporangium aurantiacum]GIJ60575.1 aldehyde dehydrogenase [Virgisporangium aurantiacum]
MRVHEFIYVDGGWADADAGERIEVINPATERVIASVPAAGPADVDAAVESAQNAADEWAATPPDRRAAHLAAFRDALAARRGDAVGTIVKELGAPVTLAERVHVGLPLTVLDSYVKLLAEYEFEERVGNSRVFAEPVGVVGAITPWNYPLHQAVAKVAAALAAGCPVVLKPAEDTPLVAYLLAEAAHAADLPPGVFNLVPGTGPVAGEALVRHPGVDMVSFTGSTAVGERIGELCAGQIKRVALELGGKSANVILPGTGLDGPVAKGVANAYLNSGQTCSAWTRMLVPSNRYAEAVDLAATTAATFTCGDPRDPKTRLGPLVNAKQRDRVRGYIGTGVREGATIVAGGPDSPLDLGFYVQATVLADVRPDATVAQEEIFGPVLVILAYDDVDEAVAIANGTPYGLSGAVFGPDEETAVAFARRMKAGQIDINGGRFNPLAPFGGVKKSGIGREFGTHGLGEFLEYKSLQL